MKKTMFLLMLFLLTMTFGVFAACVEPSTNLTISSDTTFCPGDYYAYDMGFSADNITLTFNNTNLHFNDTHQGNEWGDVFYINVGSRDGIEIKCINNSTINLGNWSVDGTAYSTYGMLQYYSGGTDAIDVIGCNFQGPDYGDTRAFRITSGSGTNTTPNARVINNTFINTYPSIAGENTWMGGNYFEFLQGTIRFGDNDGSKFFEGTIIDNIFNMSRDEGVNNIAWESWYVGDVNITQNHFFSDTGDVSSTWDLLINGTESYIYDNQFDNIFIDDQTPAGIISWCVDGQGNYGEFGGGAYSGDSYWGVWCPYIEIDNPTNSTTANSITVGNFNINYYEPVLQYYEWYIDGSLDANNSNSEHTYESLTEDQEYNITVIAYANATISDTWEGFITASAPPCVNPTSNMQIFSDTTFCPGDYYVSNIEIYDNVELLFNNTNLHWDGNDNRIITMTGNNIIIDCQDKGLINGTADYDAWTGLENGIQLDTINNSIIRNCEIKNSLHVINGWVDQNNMVFENLLVEGNIHGGGHNAYYNNIDFVERPMEMYLFGYNISANNIYSSDGNEPSIWLGHPDSGGELDDLIFSGTIMNSVLNNIQMGQAYDYNDPFNITGNTILNTLSISVGGSNGEQFIYDNNIEYVNDATDYSGGDYITWCVDDVGNDITTYEGSHEWLGTCQPPSCSDGIVDGCMFNESIEMAADGEYDNLSLSTYADDIVIDCNNSLFRAALREDVNDVTFLDINNDDITLKNCRFDGYTKIATIGGNNIMFDNIWDDHVRTISGFDGQDYAPGLFYTVDDTNTQGRNVTINNSYISGEVQLTLRGQEILNYAGDFCPDSEGEYVINSENCLNWELQETEEDCNPDMWNGSVCLDSRGTWEGGSCNECADDGWDYTEGTFVGCEITNEPLNFVLENSIINRTNSELEIGGVQMFDHDPFPFTTMASNINIINNSYYWPELSGQHSLMGRIAGGENHEIANNYFYGGKAGISLTGTIEQYEGGDCQTTNTWVHNNYAHPIETSQGGTFTTDRNKNTLIENNIIDYSGSESTSGSMVFGLVDNVTVRNNNITGLTSQYSMYTYWWESDNIHNLSLYNNYFDGDEGYRLLVGGNSENNDVEFYNNTVSNGNLGLVAYQADICKGGIGNGIGNQLQIYLAGIGYEYTLDSDCPVINVPGGLQVISEDGVSYSFKLNGNGVTINGTNNVDDSYSPLRIEVDENNIIENSSLSNLSFTNYALNEGSIIQRVNNFNISNVHDESINIIGSNINAFNNVLTRRLKVGNVFFEGDWADIRISNSHLYNNTIGGNIDNTFWGEGLTVANGLGVLVEDNIIFGNNDDVPMGALAGEVDNIEYRNNIWANSTNMQGLVTWGNANNDNISIHDNIFDNTNVWLGGIDSNYSFYNNEVETLTLEGTPDICNGGIGNDVNKLRMYKGPYSAEFDFNLDTDCPILNVPNGLTFLSEDSSKNITFNGNGVIVNGTGDLGINVTSLNNSVIENVSTIGFTKSLVFEETTNGNEYKNSDVTLPYYDYGSSNTFSTLEVTDPVLLSSSGPSNVYEEIGNFGFQVSTVAEIDSCKITINGNELFTTSDFTVNDKTPSKSSSVTVSTVPEGTMPWTVTCTDVFGNVVQSSESTFNLHRNGGGGGGSSGGIGKAVPVVDTEKEEDEDKDLQETLLDIREKVLETIHPENEEQAQEQKEQRQEKIRDIQEGASEQVKKGFAGAMDSVSQVVGNVIQAITNFFTNIFSIFGR